MKRFGKWMIAAAAVVGSFGSSTAVAVQSQQERVIYFYDSETYTNEVGGILVYCDGTRVRWGQYSLYSQEYYFGCD